MTVWRRGVMALVVAAGGLLISACDDKPEVPQAVLDQATTQAADKGPKHATTQELISGHRKTLLLTPLPLTMQVPESWKLEPLKGTSVMLLNGPTPTNENTSIQLSI